MFFKTEKSFLLERAVNFICLLHLRDGEFIHFLLCKENS